MRKLKTVRTTVDLDESLANKVKEYSLRSKKSQKLIVSEAIEKYVVNDIKQQNADQIWQEFRKIAKSGRQDVNLTEALIEARDKWYEK